jgi:DNA-3-methyladenine glycosylase II
MTDTIILDMETPSVQYLCQKDKLLAKVISMVGPITYVPHNNGDTYPFLLHEVIEQMLSIKAGKKIYSRLEDLCDGKVTPENVYKLSNEQLKSIGTSSSKVRCIREVTEAVMCGDLDFSKMHELSDDEVLCELTKLHGIGNWTAKMYLIFVLDRPDVLPYEDVAFLQGYKWAYKTDDVSPDSIKKKCRKWKPYSSIAARFLYRALDAGMTKKDFHLYK